MHLFSVNIVVTFEMFDRTIKKGGLNNEKKQIISFCIIIMPNSGGYYQHGQLLLEL
jgi:hypothetical protein